MRGELPAAVAALNQAATLEPSYPEPHLLLGRIYHRLGQPEKAKAEIARFQQLKNAAETKSTAQKRVFSPSN